MTQRVLKRAGAWFSARFHYKPVFIVFTLLALAPAPGFAAAGSIERGGVKPCLASCCIGPRVGLELNEGITITDIEYINVCIPFIVPIQAYEKNGFEGALWAWLVGPRVGMQFDRRRPRKIEKVIIYSSAATYAVGCCALPVLLYGHGQIALEAMKGRTMTEIEAEEGLAK